VTDPVSDTPDPLQRLFGDRLYGAARRLVDEGCVYGLRIAQAGRVITGFATDGPQPADRALPRRVYIRRTAEAGQLRVGTPRVSPTTRALPASAATATATATDSGAFPGVRSASTDVHVGGVLQGECSCGGRSPCVHIAAVSIAATNRPGADVAAAAGASAAAPSVASPTAPLSAPSAVATTHTASPRAANGSDPNRSASARQLLCYLVDMDAAGNLMLSLWVGLSLAGRHRAEGLRLQANSACPFTPRPVGATGEFPRYVDAQDRALLRELLGLQPEGHWPLRGKAGAALLRRALASDRVWWRNLDGAPLRAGAARSVHLDWETLSNGDQQLHQPRSTTRQATLELLLGITPAICIDPARNEWAPLSLPYPEALLRDHWNRPMRAEDIEVLNDDIARQDPKQRFPRLRPLSVVPQARRQVHARLLLGPSAGTHPAGMHVEFLYNGLPVDSRTLRTGQIHVRCAAGASDDDECAPVIYEIERDPAAEAQLIQRLDRALDEHGPGLAGAGDAGWLAFMMRGVPALKTAGWEVIILPGFPYQVVDSDDWYADIDALRKEAWFDLQLGIVVDGQQINLLPALVSYLQGRIGARGLDQEDTDRTEMDWHPVQADSSAADEESCGSGSSASSLMAQGVGLGVVGLGVVEQDKAAADSAESARPELDPRHHDRPDSNDSETTQPGARSPDARSSDTAALLSSSSVLAPQPASDAHCRSGEHVLIRIEDGRWLPVTLERIERIANTLVELLDRTALNKQQALSLPVAQASRLAQLSIALDGTALRSNERSLLTLVEDLSNFQGIAPLPAPQGFQASLRAYQQEGLGWLQFLRHYRLGGILADDMGLGKTVQTIAHLLLEKQAGRLFRPALIVAPVSVLGNWQNELRRFAPQLRTLTLHGPRRKALFAEIGRADVLITGYPLLAIDAEILCAREFSFAILDEAQTIKNPRAKVSQVARALRAEHRLCLTGTPMENHLGELWSLFDFLQPGLLGQEKQFQRHYRTPIEKHRNQQRREALVRRIGPFVLRRTKDQVARELPPKTQIIEALVLEERQRDFYDGIRLAMHQRVLEVIQEQGLARSRITVLDALLRLRQACCDPRLIDAGGRGASPPAEEIPSAKMDWLRTVLPELVAEGRRILLFSQFTSMLALIEDSVKQLGISYCLLTGATRERTEVIQRFQAGEAPLFLISLKAGGTGLNLTAADTVIHYDPWWNPAAEGQATDRAHRIGQDKPVFVYKLIAQGTVEEKILQLQADKHDLANQLYSQKNASPAQMSASDLEALFES